MDIEPFGDGGRDSTTGRFATGNEGGPGNPHARRVGQMRSALLAAVSDEDIRSTIAAIVQQARDGDLAAAKILFDRCIGPPVAADILERLEALEAMKGGT
jgi:hypothetical protein